MNYFLLIGVLMFASRTKIAAGGNATSLTTAVPAAGTTAASGSSGMTVFNMLAEEFSILKAKDEALTEKVAALKAKVDRKVDALTAEVAALKTKVGAFRKGCITGTYRADRTNTGSNVDWDRDTRINFGRSFSGIPKVTASITGFERTQAANDPFWGINLSILSGYSTASSTVIRAHCESTTLTYIDVSWVACAA